MRIVPEDKAQVQVGQTINRLTVLGVPFYLPEKSRKRRQNVVCECRCGTIAVFVASNVLRSLSRSCGCYQSEVSSQKFKAVKRHGSYNGNFVHGHTRTPLYRVWAAMKRRCYNANTAAYKDYGGRGVVVCDEWRRSFMQFRQWALENGYQHGLEVDRRDNDGGYSPDNCRFTTRTVQANNTRANVYLEAHGEKKTIAEWARDPRCRISVVALRHRLDRGWPIIKALGF